MHISYKVLNIMTGQYVAAQTPEQIIQLLGEFAWKFYQQQSQNGAVIRVLNDDCGHEVWQALTPDAEEIWGADHIFNAQNNTLTPLQFTDALSQQSSLSSLTQPASLIPVTEL